MYCGDGNKSKYAREMQKCAKIAKTDIQTYIERRLKCLDQQKPNQQETKETNYLRFLNLWEALPVKNEIPTEKDELEKIKQEIQSQGNV